MRARATSLSPRDPAEPAARWTGLIIGTAFALALVRLAGLVQDDAVNVLYGDQWDFLTPLFEGQGPWASFVRQHGPHRQGLGGVLQWALYNLSSWDVRAEAWAGVAVLAAAATAALACAYRVRGRLLPCDAVLPLIILSPLHWETLLLAPNLAHSVLPLALTCSLALIWLLPASKIRVGVIGALVVLCIFTGFGFSAAAAALLVTLASLSSANSDRRAALAIIALIIAGIAAFLIGYHWDPAVPGWHFPVADWWNYGTFVAYMLATLVGLREHTAFAATAGGLLALLVVGVFASSLWQIWAQGATRRTSTAALLTGTALAYMAFTAFGRLPVNLEAAFLWRYTTMTMPAVLGLIIFAQPWTEPAISPALRRCVVAGLCVLGVVIWGNFGPEPRAAAIAMAKRQWVQAYLTSHDLTRANTISGYWVYPPQHDAPNVAERLRWLEQHHLTFFKP
jgi:hypothetical protein